MRCNDVLNRFDLRERACYVLYAFVGFVRCSAVLCITYQFVKALIILYFAMR